MISTLAGACAPGAPAPNAEPRWNETLRDGSLVQVRPLDRNDADLERAFIERLSPRSRRLRFLGTIGTPSDALVRDLVDVDFVHDVAFAAIAREGSDERLVGVSRYALSADGASSECAVTVADEWQHKGLGTLLMRHLIDLARERGIRRMVSIDSAANGDIRELAAHLGFERRTDIGDPTEVVYTLDLEQPTPG